MLEKSQIIEEIHGAFGRMLVDINRPSTGGLRNRLSDSMFASYTAISPQIPRGPGDIPLALMNTLVCLKIPEETLLFQKREKKVQIPHDPAEFFSFLRNSNSYNLREAGLTT